MFTLYRGIALVPAQKPYRIGLCSHIRMVILARFPKRSEDAPVSKMESHMLDRCSYYNEQSGILSIV